MDPLRIALLTTDAAVLERLRNDPNRGAAWELVSADENPDHVVVDGDPPAGLAARSVLAIGDNVEHAILTGDRETHATIRDVTRDAVFLLGPRYPLAPMLLDARDRGDAEFLFAYAELHRTWMRRTCWGDMLARAIELLAGGTMQVIDGIVWIDGAPGPCRMGEAPAVCHEPEAMVTRGIPRSCPFIG